MRTSSFGFTNACILEYNASLAPTVTIISSGVVLILLSLDNLFVISNMPISLYPPYFVSNVYNYCLVHFLMNLVCVEEC